MNHAFSLIQGTAGGSAGALRVLGAGYPGRVGMTRAGTAFAFDEAGLLQPCAEHALRFSGASRRLLVEEARGNLLRNPRAEGAAAGSPGTPPTFWSYSSLVTQLNNSGLSFQNLGPVAAQGMTGMRFRISGTATATASGAIVLDTVPLSQNQVVTSSIFTRVVAGSAASLSIFYLRTRALTSGFAETAKSEVFFNRTSAALTRYSAVMTVPADSGSVTAQATVLYQVNWTSGTAVDFTADLFCPQLEIGAVTTSPILPPAGAPATAQRAVDQPVWLPPGGFGSQGTVVVRAMLPQAAPFGASQGLWQIDDGTDGNRIQLRNTSAGSAITGVVDVGGATQATLAAGNMAAGVPFRAAFSWAPGDQALCLGSGALQLASAGLPGGLARMLLGHGSSQFNRAANGEVELIDYRPTRVPNSLLQALASAG